MNTDPEKTKNYVLNIMDIKDTTLLVRLGGGYSGKYELRVHIQNKGYSNNPSQKFKYIIEIHSISPLTGSFMGGTVLTIAGKNFSSITNEN